MCRTLEIFSRPQKNLFFLPRHRFNINLLKKKYQKKGFVIPLYIKLLYYTLGSNAQYEDSYNLKLKYDKNGDKIYITLSTF